MTATIISPFHRNLSHLARSLPAACRSMPDAEVIVAADGAIDDCHPLAATWGARVVEIPGPAGPAVARNRAAATAHGDILVFVDADVVVSPDAVPGLCRVLEHEPDLAGVFGAYDESPAEQNFISQYRNLSHSYIHQIGSPDAATFWGGLGAIRATVFRELGGFDETFDRPSIEDVELGCRATRAGYRLRLDHRLRGCHLKRWTLWGGLATDVTARGIPWAQMIQKFHTLRNDLNTRTELRLSVVLAYVFLLAVGALVFTPWAAIGAAASLLALVVINYRYYRWFARVRDVGFALRVIPVHLLHHLANGVSFVVGTALFVAGRMGIRIRGAIPAAVWPAGRDIP
jgi:GT2 family glycosyltransferase